MNCVKNFIASNIKELTNSKAKNKGATGKVVESRFGNTINLKASGLLPDYSARANFGKVPRYITKRKQDIEQIKESLRRQHLGKEPVIRRKMHENERCQLLQNLWCQYKHLQEEEESYARGTAQNSGKRHTIFRNSLDYICRKSKPMFKYLNNQINL
ncbi:hypothetical protein GJ496_009107 [Pomphorhynchus laevis]|nr:hypothetical protein GJ496_009107 [Pomphorhynchus laevis]